MNNNEPNDPFWVNKISVLFREDRITEFFPSEDMNLAEKLNSLVRLSFYVSFILVLYKKDLKFLTFSLLGLVFTYIVYFHNTQETFTNTEECTKPTENNPFMNVLLSDYTDNPKRPPACNVNNPEIKKEMEMYFNRGLYKDVNDPFDKNNSQRQFYTMPSTTIPNDQKAFGEWLFGQKDNCKDNNLCEPYTDLRHHNQELVYRDSSAEDIFKRFETLNTRVHPVVQTYN